MAVQGLSLLLESSRGPSFRHVVHTGSAGAAAAVAAAAVSVEILHPLVEAIIAQFSDIKMGNFNGAPKNAMQRIFNFFYKVRFTF